jgi:TPR repeat protein
VQLGDAYDTGAGVKRDVTEAIKWYRRAAEQGNAEGQYSLGGKYDSGDGVAQDFAEALKWYRKAAEQGTA